MSDYFDNVDDLLEELNPNEYHYLTNLADQYSMTIPDVVDLLVTDLCQYYGIK